MIFAILGSQIKTTVSFPRKQEPQTQLHCRHPMGSRLRENGTWKFFLLSAIAWCTTVIAIDSARAQPYPARPIRLVVPFPPGGGLDVVGRVVATQVEQQLGQPIVVDNRGGANGVIGSELVARAVADGYTLMNNGGALLVGQLVNKNLPYNIERDFAPITSLGRGTGYLLLVNGAGAINSVKDLIALAKSTAMSYGSAGVGNPNHLAAALLTARAGFSATNVPYRGTAPSMTALMANEVQFAFSPPQAVMQQVKAGRLRALAFSAATRFPLMPQLPTLAEAGVKDYRFDGGMVCWHAPAGTPAAIVNRLQGEVAKAVQVAKVREAIEAGGYHPGGETPGEFAKFIKSELITLREAVAAAKLTPQ